MRIVSVFIYLNNQHNQNKDWWESEMEKKPHNITGHQPDP